MNAGSTSKKLGEYLGTLESLLADCTSHLTDRELIELRAIVHDRRHGRKADPGSGASTRLAQRADGIVKLLGAAACDLRPRETQQLDDLVAGRRAEAAIVMRSPVRFHKTRSTSR